MINTKIVATIGPVTKTREALLSLREAGMDVARLNGSHADLEWHSATIRLIRETLPDVPILLDIPGRKIRTLQLAHEPKFGVGDIVILTVDVSHDGSEKVPLNYPYFHEALSVDDVILADDGTLRFVVVHVEGEDVHCRAEIAGRLRSRKGINVPFVKLKTALVTERDKEMMAFAQDHGVDFVGISFVESAAHIEAIRELRGGSKYPWIVSKVENTGGLENLEEIVESTDVVMIDRGDLSIETNLESLAVFQKKIILAAKGHAKPVIVATEILHTMIDKPFPTKAEVSDITNAVLDGAAATMLSGETAIGDYPVEAVSVMRQVSIAAHGYLQDCMDETDRCFTQDAPSVTADAIAMMCRSLPITKIVAVTLSGYAARMIANRSPRQQILAVSSDRSAVRACNLLPGTKGVHVDVEFQKQNTNHVPACIKALWQDGELVDDDYILITAVNYPKSGNRMNMIETHALSDLVDTLGWRV